MAEPDPRLGTILDGRYRLEHRLGAGGMGVVYRAERVGIGKVVAVKFLQEAAAAMPALVKRFRREVAAASRLDHPHLTGVIDSGVSNGAPYLVMEFERGKNLGSLLRAGRVPAPRAVGIARQILSALAHAHAGGIVHRDLKPDNVILLDGNEGDFVKVLDFGLAKIVRGDGEDATALTQEGLAIGTPSYMSPEQARGERADRRSDVYSVGVILYCMVVGRKPFAAEKPMDLLRMHMYDPPPPPRRVAGEEACSPALERAILRALEKAPAKRFPSADAFAEALVATPEGRESAVPAVGRAAGAAARARALADARRAEKELAAAEEAPRRRRPRHRLLTGIGLALAAVVLWALLYPAAATRVQRRIEAAARALFRGR